MKKKIALSLLSVLALCQAVPVHAETYYGDDSWSVQFTSDKEMNSNFKTSDINDVVGGMQPGDNVIITLDLENKNNKATDWYMQNEVLYSLEDRSANSQTGGGAYTYHLDYTDSNGNVTVLYDSDTVGGESADDTINKMGLRSATDALKEFFYLDTLETGQKGMVTLEVALDGETQGNSYQDTLADLQMNFAVELRNRSGSTGGSGGGSDPDSDIESTGGGTTSTSPERTEVVKTGDDSNILLYSVLLGISGLLLMMYCIYCFRENKRSREEA